MTRHAPASAQWRLTEQIDELTARVSGDLAAQGVNADGATGPGAGQDTDRL